MKEVGSILYFLHRTPFPWSKLVCEDEANRPQDRWAPEQEVLNGHADVGLRGGSWTLFQEEEANLNGVLVMCQTLF